VAAPRVVAWTNAKNGTTRCQPLLALSHCKPAARVFGFDITPAPFRIQDMEQYLREWRKNALDKHQYETAIFIADKLLALTSSSPIRVSSSHMLTTWEFRQRSGCLVARVDPFQLGELHPRPKRAVQIGPHLAESRLQASGCVMLCPTMQVRRSARPAR
jgi:hypothetical protein